MTGHKKANIDGPQRAKGLWGEIKEFFSIIIQAVFIAFVFQTVLFQPFNIPTGSMKPNLLIGDYIMTSKYSYGYSKYSMPWLGRHLPFSGRFFGAEPERGDVVVFRPPHELDTDFIKRLIGMPGDIVQMRGGSLYINDQLVPRREVQQTKDMMFGSGSRPDEATTTLYEETLPNGKKYLIQEINDFNDYDDTQAFRVPKGHYFFIGDNRDRSGDSRAGQFTFVPFENLVGKARIRFFSIKDHTPPYKLWAWGSKVRWERLFTGIE